jgi:hypothetical protein
MNASARALANPKLADRRRDAAKALRALVGRRCVGRLREAHRGHGRRFRLECEVGQHGLHRGVIREPAAERVAMARVMRSP